MVTTENICCICLRHSKSPMETVISSKDQEDISIFKKLILCVPDVVWDETFKICNSCIITVINFYKFRNKCIESETLRKNKIKPGESPVPVLGYNCSEIQTIKSPTNNHNNSHQDGIVVEQKSTLASASDEEDNNLPSSESELNDSIPISFQHSDKGKIKSKPESVRIFECNDCGKSFKRKEHLRCHIRSKHTDEKPYECDVCLKRFNLSQSLTVHKRRHTDDRPYCCVYCGKRFSSSADLYHHDQIHQNKRQYTCASCGKSFNTASILRRHKICAHTDPSLWKYECPVCARRFPMSGNMKSHVLRHDEEKKFNCAVCDKRFYDRSVLKRHVRCHSNVRLFGCNLCSKEYKDNGSLGIHLKKVHGVGDAVIPKRVKKFVCHLCAKAFASDCKLQKHINSHKGIKPFRCDFCEKSFADSWYRNKHIESKHNWGEVLMHPKPSD